MPRFTTRAAGANRDDLPRGPGRARARLTRVALAFLVLLTQMSLPGVTEVPTMSTPPMQAPLVPGLFEIEGNPYRNTLKFRGAPLSPDQIFAVLDLTRPELARVRASVAAGDVPRASAELLVYYRSRRHPTWPGESPRTKEGVAKQPPSAEDLHVAENAIRHVFKPEAFGPEVDYGPDIDWDYDPYADVKPGSFMHMFFNWAGAVTNCYRATGEERFAQIWVELTSDWIRKNPVNAQRLGFPYSWDALPAGGRCSEWVQEFPSYLDSPACTPEFLTLLLTALYNHARRIQLMPYQQNDNFIIVESAGLADVAMAFPEFREASLWRETAFARLEEAVRRQFHPDGVQAELAPTYHRWCADMLAQAGERAAAFGYHPSFLKMVEKMGEVTLGISAPDGTLFRVGDSGLEEDIRPHLLHLGTLFHRRDFLARATDGKQGVWPKKRRYAFPDGGFYSFRSDWSPQAVWLALHCGPPSCESYAFHSQFDNGTFELMAYGRMLMRDPGVNSYTEGDPEREQFRRTAAHQTLTLNGENSLRQGRLLQWVEEDGRGNAVLTVENAGYPGLTHRRTVFFVADRYVVLLDEALGTAQGDLDLHFQFTPGPVIVDAQTKTARTAFPEGGNVLVWSDAQAPVVLEKEEAWFSPAFHQKEPLPACRYRHQSRQAPARFLTVLAPFRGSEAPEVRAQVAEGAVGANRVVIVLQAEGHSFRLERRLPGG